MEELTYKELQAYAEQLEEQTGIEINHRLSKAKLEIEVDAVEHFIKELAESEKEPGRKTFIVRAIADDVKWTNVYTGESEAAAMRAYNEYLGRGKRTELRVL